jgi:hypothetical protein
MLIYVLRWQTAQECSLDGPLQIYVFCSEMKFKMAAMAGLSLTLDPMGNIKIVEDHPMNIHVQFGFNHICSF